MVGQVTNSDNYVRILLEKTCLQALNCVELHLYGK